MINTNINLKCCEIVRTESYLFRDILWINKYYKYVFYPRSGIFQTPI